MESLSEKLSYKRSNKDHHKPTKLSKVNIGHPLEKNDQVSKSAEFPGTDGSGPSMAMKVIVITRDERGYGLTLSGDNPVHVQSVKEDGPAAKAGLVKGDKLIKVNGETVTNKNHVEVVKLFKGKHVALTLIGAPSSVTSSDTSSPSDVSGTNQNLSVESPEVNNESANQGKEMEMTKDNPFYIQKVQTIRKMLGQEEEEVKRLMEEYARNPDEKTLKKLGQGQKLLEDLKKQLWKVESNKETSVENPSVAAAPVAATTEVDGRFNLFSQKSKDEQVSLISMDESDFPEEKFSNDSLKQAKSPGYNSAANSFQAENLSENLQPGMVVGEDKSNMDLVNEFLPNNAFNSSALNAEKGKSVPQNVEILNFEDDDDIVAEFGYQDHGPFSDLEMLRQSPAHMAVFFNYVVGTKEPAEFLLTLSVDTYKQLTNTKDMLKSGDVIFKTYLGANAAYKVEVDNGISQSIQHVLHSKNPSEEGLRGVFDPAVQVANKKIRTQLTEYRMKREQGLGSLFGDEKLHHAVNLDQQSDIRIVDEIISPTLTEWLQKVAVSDEMEQLRQTIVLEALQSFLNQYGTKRVKKPTNRIYSMLRSKPNNVASSKSKSTSSQDSFNEENRRSGIGNFFGGKTRRPIEKLKGSGHQTKKDKVKGNTIWENPPGLSEPLRPIKVNSNAELAGTGLNEPDDRNLAHLRRSERTESMYNPASGSKEAPLMRPKSMPPEEWLNRGRAHTVTILSTPSLQEPVLNELNLMHYDDENEDVTDDTSKMRNRRKDTEKRLSLGSNKSNSDPDKNKVLQAVEKHTAMEQGEGNYRPHVLSSAESTLSLNTLNIEDRRLLDQLPSFTGDPEIDIDAEEQQWTDIVPKSVTKDLDKKEIKRQQIINELISTEKHHVRDLKIIEQLFYEKCLSDGYLTEEDVKLMFPNLKDILNLHRELNKCFTDIKEKDGHVVKAIGDSLLSRFDGCGGNNFKTECSTYCGNQSAALSFIKDKTKKDQSFKQFLQVAQKHPVCRKFHLKDFIPLEFQRLTKYPLLLENIAKNTKKKHDSEIEKIKKACERCRDILAFVNQTIKEAEDRQKIKEIQQSIDREPLSKAKNQSSAIKRYKDIDLTDRPVIHQGPLTWRIGLMEKRKAIPLHCILYDDVLVLLQKQDDRYVLKCQGSQSSHAPFICMDGKVIVRSVATDKKAFFVMPTSDVGPQMYELAAASGSIMKKWMSLITEISSKKRDTIHIAETTRRPAFSGASVIDQSAGNLIGRAEENHSQSMPMIPSASECYEKLPSSPAPAISDDLLLRIKTKHQEINRALAMKFKLLAELSGLSEADLGPMLDMSAADSEPDPSILIKHSIFCVDKLQGLLNESATPESSFVKSRNQSQVDVPGLNQIQNDSESNYAIRTSPSNTPEKWATPVTHPNIRSSTVASASSPINGAMEQTGSEFPHAESDSVFSPGIESSVIENGDREATVRVGNPESVSLYSIDAGTDSSEENIAEATEDNDRLSPSVDLADTSSPDQDQNNRLSLSENQGDELAQSREQTDFSPPPKRLIRPSISSDAFPPPERSEIENTPNLSIPDDVSNPSKSRPVSGIEICVPSGDVPVSRLMEIVFSLQTQLTQLMQVTEEDEQERQRLLEENKQLKKQLETRQKSVSVTSLPSYADAVQDTGHPRLKSSASAGRVSIEQDIAYVRASLLRHDNVYEPVDEPPSFQPPTGRRFVTRRSTGF